MNAEDAFINSKERNVFVATAPAQHLLDTLEQGLAHASPVIVLTGETGLGKTTIMREAAARWADRVHAAWLDAGRVPVDDLFGQTIRRFGGHYRATDQRPEQVGRFAVALNAIHTRKLTPVLVVDDAHELSLVAIAELGRIESAAAATNVPFKLVLIGRPALLDLLADESLQQFTAHIAERGTIEAMSVADTREYLAHRVHAAGGDTSHGFSKKAAREIHTAANGVPSVVNALSDEAQRCAHAAGTAMVGPEHVRAVIAAAIRSEPGTEPEPEPAPEPAPETRPHGKEKKGKPKFQIPEKPKVIAAHKAPTTPPSAVAHVPPPTLRQSTPLPPMSDLDATSPRVRDWVSRFTDGQPPIRFGARITPPAREAPSKAFDPDLVPPPTEVSPKELEPVAELSPATQEVAYEPEFVERRRDVPVSPASPASPASSASEKPDDAKADAGETQASAAEPAPERAEESAETAEPDKPEPPKLVIDNGHGVPPSSPALEIIGLAPEDSLPVVAEARPVPLEVKPEQLASPPLEVDEAPAPYTPEPPAEASVPEPAAASDEPVREPVIRKTPLEPEAIQKREPVVAPARPAAEFKPSRELTAADVRPVMSKKQRAAARRAERAARRAAEAAARKAEIEARSKLAPAAPQASSAPAKHGPAAAKHGPAAAKHGPAAAKPAPSAPMLGSPSSTTIATVLSREPKPVSRSSNGPRSPRHARYLAGVITGLIMLGMAAAAILMGRRGGLRSLNDETAVTSTPPQAESVPMPAPVVPVPAATPDTAADTTPSAPKAREPAPIPEDEPVVDDAVAGRWSLVVGSYLYEDRAKQMAGKLARRTKQIVRVVPDGRGSEKAYRIFYGSYATEAAAVRAADRLLARGVVSEAMVERNPE